MTEEFWLIFGVVALASAILCGFLAPMKGRPSGTWAFFGLVFGVFAVLALAFVTKREPPIVQASSNPVVVAVLAVLVVGALAIMVAMLNGWL